MQLLREHGLVLLNTWGRANRGHACTYVHGSSHTHVDFVVTRRVTADQISRATRPTVMDLVPWRLGPKHRPIAGSIPFVAGWAVRRCLKLAAPEFNVHALREAFRRGDARLTEQLKLRIEELVASQTSTDSGSLAVLNRQILQLCVALFPKTRTSKAPPQKVGVELEQRQDIHRLWDMHRQLRQLKHLKAEARTCNNFAVWRAYEAMSQQYRRLKRARVVLYVASDWSDE